MNPASAPSADEATPRGLWRGANENWTLEIAGDWRHAAQPLPAPPEALRAGRVAVDAAGLTGWDVRLASALWSCLAALSRPSVTLELNALPKGLQQILSLALPAAPPVGGAAVAVADTAADEGANASGPLRLGPRLAALGRHVAERGVTVRKTLTFFGDTLLAFGRLARGRTDMRAADLAWQIEQTGPRSLPIIALVSFQVGLIVAYMGAGQLVRFGAATYIADLVTVGVVREIAALLVGIVLAGRVGAAFAAQIGSMRANEEVDALQTLGVNPIEHLVLPRVIALLLVGPLLTAFAAVVGAAAGWLVAVVIFGVTPLEYGYKSLQALTLAHVLIGLAKGTVYALLVALAGCFQGLSAGRSAQAVGEATTAAVVQAIVWLVVAASAMTVMFQRLDW